MYPLRIHLLCHFIMATQTQVGTLRQEQRVQRRLVRVVAARAVTGDHRLVGTRRRRQLVSDIVTFRAHRALLTDQGPLERARVRVVARQAITVAERIVGISARCLLHEFLMAFGAEI